MHIHLFIHFMLSLNSDELNRRLLHKNKVIEAAYFSKNFHCIELHNPTLNGTSVAATSQYRPSAMLVLFMTGT
jgi:hypothetical protein